MNKTWSTRVYGAAGTTGFLLGTIGLGFMPNGYLPWSFSNAVPVFGGAGSVLAIVLTALVDFVVHGWWRRPPTDPDPWSDTE